MAVIERSSGLGSCGFLQKKVKKNWIRSLYKDIIHFYLLMNSPPSNGHSLPCRPWTPVHSWSPQTLPCPAGCQIAHYKLTAKVLVPCFLISRITTFKINHPTQKSGLPALRHFYEVLLVGNNTQLCQGLKQIVTLQNQITLKEQTAPPLIFNLCMSMQVLLLLWSGSSMRAAPEISVTTFEARFNFNLHFKASHCFMSKFTYDIIAI